MRDLRDPEIVGLNYLKLREHGMEIHDAVLAPADKYRDGGHISANPANHHSKTPQNVGSLDDGGTS